MPSTTNSAQSEADTVAQEIRPADLFVYCKGCGKQLESRARLQKPRAVVDSMMCEPCKKKHGHALMPKPGAPTFCYRCGGPEEVIIEPGTTPVIHHLCPTCLPERTERYRAGDFEEPKKVEPEPEAAATTPTAATTTTTTKTTTTGAK